MTLFKEWKFIFIFQNLSEMQAVIDDSNFKNIYIFIA